MQRDMNLVRAILLKLEAHPHGFAPALEIEGYTDEQIGFHVALMGQAGLIDAYPTNSSADETPSAMPLSLKWEGYEFLAASKDEGIWKKGTSTVMAKAGAIGFEILKAVLTAEVRRQVGLP
jgi:hypothetical protein